MRSNLQIQMLFFFSFDFGSSNIPPHQPQGGSTTNKPSEFLTPLPRGKSGLLTTMVLGFCVLSVKV